MKTNPYVEATILSAKTWRERTGVNVVVFVVSSKVDIMGESVARRLESYGVLVKPVLSIEARILTRALLEKKFCSVKNPMPWQRVGLQYQPLMIQKHAFMETKHIVTAACTLQHKIGYTCPQQRQYKTSAQCSRNTRNNWAFCRKRNCFVPSVAIAELKEKNRVF